MREVFEEAYISFTEGMNGFRILAQTIAEALVWFTIPFWVLPYMIVRRWIND